ncbi:hypothetical protein HDU96_001098 [Phlyctochytrium bullatum]|nr:hypothetical protein HDU96_001098 [Phlyctochytrium bullatum]
MNSLLQHPPSSSTKKRTASSASSTSTAAKNKGIFSKLLSFKKTTSTADQLEERIDFALVPPPRLPSISRQQHANMQQPTTPAASPALRMLSASSEASYVSTASTLVGTPASMLMNPAAALKGMLASPPQSPLMNTIDATHHHHHPHHHPQSSSPFLDVRHHHHHKAHYQPQPPSAPLHVDSEDDLRSDAGLDTNERRARAAVRHALRNAKLLDRFKVDAIVGFGSNGVVLRATPLQPLASHPTVHQVAVKIIYRSSSASATASGSHKPNEITLLDLITRSSPHPNLLSHLLDWEDAKHFYLVTELHGAKPTAAASADDNAPLAFWNPRLNRREYLTVAPGTTDLWTWSLHMSNRAYPAWTQGRAPFTTPSVTYRLNPPPLPMVRGIFAQVAAGVHHLHSIGVAHGDLKEENILLDGIDVPLAEHLDRVASSGQPLDMDQLAVASSPAAMVCDFGHATTGHPRPPRIVSYGTREMTPPELLPNLAARAAHHPPAADADPFAADVFALGMCLFSLLHGPGCLPPAVLETVRGGRNLASVQHEAGLSSRSGRYPVGPVRADLGSEARECLEGMLCTDPARRWTMDQVLCSPWVRGVLEAAQRVAAASA